MNTDRRQEAHIFWLAASVRLLFFLVIYFSGETLHTVSRDSAQFHRVAIDIADRFASGENDWSRWIDDAWPEFVGLVYYLVVPSLLPVMVINAALAGGAAVLTYRVAWMATGVPAVAKASAYALALFPSAVFFQSLPLKECAAAFAILSVLYGVLRIRLLRIKTGWTWIAAGLLIIAGLRVYLVPILAACVLVSLLPLRTPRRLTGLFVPAVCVVLLVSASVYTIRVFNIDVTEYEALQYFDLDKLNRTRASLSRGSGKIFSEGREAEFGQDTLNDAELALKGVFYFVAGVDPLNVRSGRQLMAIPEMLVLLYCLPFLIIGLTRLWHFDPRAALPLILVTLAIITVYGAGTTNLGAMYRWRLQALPCFFIFTFYGAYHRRKGLLFTLLRRLERTRGRYRFHPPMAGGASAWEERQVRQ